MYTSSCESRRLTWRAPRSHLFSKLQSVAVLLQLIAVWSILPSRCASAAEAPIIGNQLKDTGCPIAHVGNLYVNDKMVNSSLSTDFLQVTVVEVGKSTLPNWLVLTPSTHELKGVPLTGESGEYNMFVNAIDKDLKLSAQLFSLKVIPRPETRCERCTVGNLVTMATVVFAVDYKGLGASERVRVFTQVAKTFNVSPNNITVKVTTNKAENETLPICNKTLVENGLGLGSNRSSAKFLAVSWIISTRWLPSFSDFMNKEANNKSVSDSIGFAIVRWHLMTGNPVVNCSNSSLAVPLTTAVTASMTSFTIPLVDMTSPSLSSYYPTTAVMMTSLPPTANPSASPSSTVGTSLPYISTTHIQRNSVSWLSQTHVPSSSLSSSIQSIEGSIVRHSSDLATTSIQPSRTQIVSSIVDACRGDAPPKVTKSFGPINLEIGKVQQYVIPRQTFSDNEDGSTRELSLALLHPNGSKLQEDYWVELTSTTQSLFIVPTINELHRQPKNSYGFVLRAQDKCGNTVDLHFTIVITGHPQAICFKTNMTVKSSFNTNVPTVVIKEWLLGLLQNYLGDERELYFLSYKKGQNDDGIFTLLFSSKSIKCPVCDVNQIETFYRKFLYSNGSVNYELSKSLSGSSGSPWFTVVAVKNSSEVCISSSFYTVHGTAHTSGMLLSETIVRSSSVELYTTHAKLRTTFYQDSRETMPINTVHESTQVMLSSITVPSSFVRLQSSYISKKHSISSSFNERNPTTVFSEALYPSTSQLVSSTHVFGSRSFSLKSVPTPVETLSMYQTSTAQSSITRLSSLTQILSPTQIVLVPSSAVIGPFNSPPVVRRQLPSLRVLPCSMLEFKIPWDTFYDLEDGNTTLLQLKVATVEGNPLGPDSWVQFNMSTQILSAIPTGDTYSKQSNYSYILIAEDKQGMKVETNVTIFIEGSIPKLNYKTRMLVRGSFDDEPSSVEQLSVLVKAISKYLGDKSGNYIFIESFVRGTGVRPLTMITWGNCTLDGSTCNDATVKFISDKLAIKNGVNSNLSASLLPQFNLEMISEQRLGPCAKETNYPPALRTPIELRNITSLCKPFQFEIPQNTFADREDGNTRHLQLSLVTHDLKTLAKDSWIQFDVASQKVYGFPTAKEISNQSEYGYRYVLIAKDSGSKLARAELRLKIEAKPISSNYNVTVTVHSYIDPEAPAVGLVLQLMGKIAGYLGTSGKSGLKVLHYSRTQGNQDGLTITFTNCSRYANGCDYEDMKYIGSRMISAVGKTTQPFQRALLPYFVVVEVLESRSGECIPNNSPITRRSLILFNVSLCKRFRFQIPEDVFYDIEDGSTSNLSLVLLTYSKEPISKSSWIQFDNVTRQIYGIPIMNISITEPNMVNRYILIARDKQGKESNLSVTIAVQPNTVPLRYNLSVTVTSYLKQNSSDVDMLNELFKKIKIYLHDSSSKSALLISYERGASNSWPYAVSVRWSNCSINQNISIVGSKDDPMEKLKLTNGLVNPSLIQSLAPEFIVKSIEIHVRVPPSNTPPMASVSILKLNVSSCKVLQYLVPNATFYDKEDAILKLRLLEVSGRQLPEDYWLQLNQTYSSIYGIPTAAVAKQQPHNGYQYLLVAEDSKGLQTNVKVLINITGFENEPNLKLTIVFQSLMLDKTSSADKQLLLIHKLSSYFGHESMPNIRVEWFTQGIGNQPLNLFSWSNCSLPSHQCDIEAVLYITKMLKGADGGIHPNLQRALGPEFSVVNVIDQRLGYCKGDINTPPKLNKPVQTLNISMCNRFRFKIPNDTFIDREDGNTRHLSLILTKTNSKPLDKDSWIQMDAVSQQVYAFPTLMLIQNKTFGEHRLLLVARDSGGKTANTELKLFIVSVPAPIYYQTVITAESYYDATLPHINHAMALLEKTSTYLGLDDSNGITAVSWNKSASYPALLSLTFTNCSWPKKPCNLLIIKNILAVFKTKSGQNKPEFARALLPNFVLRKVEGKQLGLCPTIPNTPPIASIPLLTKNITVCGVLSFVIPPETFHDLEDGGTRNLTLSLLTFGGTNLHPSHWLQFDPNSQRVYGIPIEGENIHYKYRVIARDRKNLEANTTLKIFINATSHPYSYVVNMSFSSYVDPVLSKPDFFTRLLKYFGGKLPSNRLRLLSYIFTNSTPRVVHVSWTDCALKYFPCDYMGISSINDKLKLPGGYLNPDLIRALAPEFIIDSVDQIMRGPCMNTRPVILKPISPINVPLCHVFRFVIPLETFYDKEEGYTRNLSISLLESNGNPIDTKSWVQFNRSSQTIYGVPTLDVANVQPKYGSLFLLLAKDEQGLAVNASLTLKITGNVPHISYKVTLAYQSFINASFYVDEFTLLVNKLTTYIRDVNGTQIKLLSTVKGSGYPSSNLIVWTDCSLPYSPCDFEKVQKISNKIKASAQLRQALLPEFSPERVFDLPTGPCKPITNAAPTLANDIGAIHMTPDCAMMKYTIPRGTFMDREDGDTRNLTLSLLSSKLQPLSSSSWVQFDTSSQQIYGLPWQKVLVNEPLDGYPYVLIARDSGGKMVRDDIKIKLSGSKQTENYQITVVVTSNLDASRPDIKHLSRLLDKIASYLNDSSPLRIIKYNKTRHDPVSLIVTWTSCLLPNNSCNHQIIKELYSKIALPNGKQNQNFTRKLFPEFSLHGVYEEKFGPCLVPINKRPRVNRILAPINISSCGEFAFIIPNDLFVDDLDGDTRNLTLRLVHINGKNLSKHSWVKLDEGRNLLYGMPTLETFRKQPVEGYQFVLVATDSGGLIQNTSFILRISGKNVANHIIDLEVVNYGFPTADDVDILIHLKRKIANYLGGGDKAMLQAIAFSRNKESSSQVTLTWSNCSLDYFPCDFQSVERLQTVLTIKQNLVNPDFMRALAPEFVVEKVNFTKFGPCLNTKPQINQALETVNASFCKVLTTPVPENLFYDKENGNTRRLLLSIASGNNTALSLNSWIQLNQSSQVLYGIVSPQVVIEQPVGGYRYILTAKDDGNLKNAATFGVSIANKPPQVSFMVVFVFESYFDANLPYVDEQLLLMRKISAFLGNADINNINVISFVRGGGYPSLNFFKWSNCSIGESTKRRRRAVQSPACDFAYVEWLLRQLKSSDGKINPAIQKYLLPTFVLKDIIDQRLGPCLETPNESPRSQKSSISLNTSLNEWNFRFRIPNDTFVDKEDGFTRYLSLTLLTSDSKSLPKGSWIQFNTVKQELYGFKTLDVLHNQPVGGYKYDLIAKDSAGKTASVKLTIYVEGRIHPSNLVFKVIAYSYIPAERPYIDHALKLTDKLSLYLNSSIGFDIQTISFNKTGTFPSTVSLFWTVAPFMDSNCDLVMMQHIVSMLESPRGTAKADLTKALSPEFAVTGVSHQKQGPCAVIIKNPPNVVNPLKALNVSFCESLNYTIPEDTFYDKEDGSTRNLMLQLLDHDGKELNFSSWIQLDSYSQTIYGLPMEEQSFSPRGVYYLVASDRDGAKINSTLVVAMFDPAPSVNNMISVNFLNYASKKEPEIRSLQRFLEKMKVYLSTKTVNSIKIVSYNSSVGFPKLVGLTWSSCVMPYKSCDYQSILTIWNKLSAGNNLVHPHFIHVVAPEFIVQNVKQIKLGPCLNRPPNATRDITLPSVDVCSKVAYRIPDNTFIDPEDGSTSNLVLHLEDFQGKPLKKDFWVYLNSSSQVLYAIPTLEQMKAENYKDVELTLSALDKGGLSARTKIQFSLNKLELKLTYKVTLALKIYYKTDISNAYVLLQLQTKLETYLSSTNGSIYFMTFTRGLSSPSLGLVSFSFCSLPQSSCDVARVNQLSSRIKAVELNTALLPMLEVTNVFEQKLGACVLDTNEPPKLARPLNPLNVTSSYGMYEYPIPDNTFTDYEDGNTRNLTLSLLKKDMKMLGRDSWIQFDSKTQKIYALPAETEYRNQPKYGYIYLLVATDSGKKYTIAQVAIYLTGKQIQSPMYQLNVTAKSFLNAETITIFHIKDLANRIGQYVGNTKCANTKWQFVEYTRSSGYPATLNAVIRTCTNTCDVSVVERVKLMLYTPQGEMSEKLKAAVAPFFVLQSIKLVGCTSSSQLVATFGRLFRSSVPEEVLSDMQERGSGNVTLRLQGPKFPTWLMLDNVRNILYGVPLFVDFQNQNGSLVNYSLSAVDQDGWKTEHIFKVFITPGNFCSSTPSLVLKLNHSYEWFMENASTRMTLMETLAIYLGGNESQLFIRSVQRLVRDSQKTILVGIVNDTMCEKSGASAFINGIVTGMRTPVGGIRSEVLEALSTFHVLDIFSRLPSAAIPRPQLSGAKPQARAQSTKWLPIFVLFSLLVLLIFIGIWLCYYYKYHLKKKGGVLITPTTPATRSKAKKYNVLEDEQDLVGVEDEYGYTVRRVEESSLESKPIYINDIQKSEFDFYNNVTNRKKERIGKSEDNDFDDGTEPSVKAEQHGQGISLDGSDDFENSRLSFEDNFEDVLAEEEAEEEEGVGMYSPPPMYEVHAPPYFLPPLLRSPNYSDSGVFTASYESIVSPPTRPSPHQPRDSEDINPVPRRQSPEYYFVEAPFSPSQRDVSKRNTSDLQLKPSPNEVQNVSDPFDETDYVIDEVVRPMNVEPVSQTFSDYEEMPVSDLLYEEIVRTPNPVLSLGPLRRSQRRKLPDLPPLPPLHRLISQSNGRTNNSPPGSPGTVESSSNNPDRGRPSVITPEQTYSPISRYNAPEYSIRLTEPIVLHVPLDLGPSTNGTTATINLGSGGTPMQVPLVLSRDSVDVPGLRVGPQRQLQPSALINYPSRFTELDSREGSNDHRNEAEDISHHLTEDLDLGNSDNRRLAPYYTTYPSSLGQQRGNRYGPEGSWEQRQGEEGWDLDLGHSWTSRV